MASIMNGLDVAGHSGLSGLVAGYGADPAIPDEMVDQTGAMRPVWRQLVAYLESLTPEQLADRFARGDQYLRDAGVFYRHYGKGEIASRDWPLSHVPVLIAESEWRMLADGLIQRAELLEAIAADLYGDNRLVAEGHLPAFLIGANPHWQRPVVGMRPASGHFLHFIAMELGRGPDGRWWVLSDRTEAPSGAGFALENRVATARTFADIYRQSNVLRVAGFFSAFKDAIQEHQQAGSSRAGILSPGSYHETYYEQAYIARYLGLMLVEGEDLVVKDGQLMVRTIAGARPVSVIWRRLESAWCDPLEFDAHSRIGTAGLVESLRSGAVTMINALGSGVLETQALHAFMPKLCEALRGEALKLPNIATWWCGQEAELAHVRDNADRMMIGPAFANRLPFELKGNFAIGGRARGIDAPDIGSWLAREQHNLVGQELVTLSTSPAWVDGRLAPRPVSIRFFLARTRQGWQVMPGGFARIGSSQDPSAIAMQQGASVADVWVVSDAPVPEITLLAREEGPFRRAPLSVLPSRAADNLYWLGRYTDRAEGLFRLLRAYHARRAETGDPDAPLLETLAEIFAIYGIDHEEAIPSALIGMIDAAVNSASHIRDRVSLDGWAALADLSSTARQFADSVRPGDDAARAYSVLIRKLTGFSGLVHENMYRLTGWRFLSAGREIERAIGTAEFVAALAGDHAPDGSLDLAIEIGDSVMTHRRLYSVTTRPESVVDLLVLDPLNPRSVFGAVARLQEHIRFLPNYEVNGRLSGLARQVLALHTALATANPELATLSWILERRDELAEVSDLLTEAYLK